MGIEILTEVEGEAMRDTIGEETLIGEEGREKPRTRRGMPEARFQRRLEVRSLNFSHLS